MYDRGKILCQDPDSEVRKIMAGETMKRICHAVGTDITESKFLERVSRSSGGSECIRPN